MRVMQKPLLLYNIPAPANISRLKLFHIEYPFKKRFAFISWMCESSVVVMIKKSICFLRFFIYFTPCFYAF
jgi:hypothetical protein